MGYTAYDIDGDGDCDEDDLIYFVENGVEIDLDGDGLPDVLGTRRGDTNIDGVVNATDLAIMDIHFGDSGPDVGWADGNLNCDDIINATDLAIIAQDFGYIVPSDAVPEPATLTLLVLGASVLGRKRKG